MNHLYPIQQENNLKDVPLYVKETLLISSKLINDVLLVTTLSSATVSSQIVSFHLCKKISREKHELLILMKCLNKY